MRASPDVAMPAKIWQRADAASDPHYSVRDALAAAIASLEACSTPAAGLTAELLLMHVLDCDRAWIYSHPEQALAATQRARYGELLERRAAGVPTQYLTGRQEFWGLQFEVTPDVLIPRPETEHVVDVALARLGPKRLEAIVPLRVADVGTGSGCLAVTLARELHRARVMATDISADALQVARRNAARHGVRSRIEFVRMNILGAFVAALDEAMRFDLIVSNPPYVAVRDAGTLAREVREHEPAQALFAGEDGLEFYPTLIEQAQSLLAAGGFLVMEVGAGQAQAVRRLLDTPGWRGVAIQRDLAGIERVVSGERSGWNTAEDPSGWRPRPRVFGRRS